MEKVVVNIDKCSKDELISTLNSIKPSDNNEPRQIEININKFHDDDEFNNMLIKSLLKNLRERSEK